ncbi:unnamed protein product [Rotaria sordida]|uniref:Uncharacterized protein n=1 Tax=Rotaria sordida TaxID=392033 RepID=A0A818VC85_9BILA|nr:unnamed protein product [Rotaria sordida]CAF3704813.1 unnamed protein product [Rotaria sordida]
MDAEVLKADPKARGTRSIIREFSVNTSTHGIPGIARSRSIQNRIFWCIATLIFTGVMIFFITQSIRAYFEYPSQTSVSIAVEWPQAFPAVTICNYSLLRYDRFIGSFLNYTNTLNLTNTTDTTNFTFAQSLYINDFLVYKLNQGESLNDLFFPLESMMMDCVYNKISCYATNFTSFISSAYGLCYTFNAKLKDSFNTRVRNSSENGGTGVLQTHFYVHQHQYVPYLSYATEMVALVHDNVQFPYIEMAGMYLAPGRHHKFSYSKKMNIFLPAPCTTCNDKPNMGMQIMFDQYKGADYAYTQFQCYTVCLQAYIYQKCGCGHPFRWAIRSVVLPGTDKAINISFCDIKNPCYIEAAAELMNTRSIWTTYCPDCTEECSTSDFLIKSSSLLAPPQFLMNDIKRFVESSKIPLPANWSTSWVSEIQSNYVSLEVVYETSRTEIYTEEATLSPVDVLSNVGGQTGLWIGISFLSLIEIAEVIYRLIRHQCYKLRKTL